MPALGQVMLLAPAPHWLPRLVELPHTFATPPPPQVSGDVHPPQLSVPPQPSEMLPQFFCWAAQVVLVHEVGVPGLNVTVTGSAFSKVWPELSVQTRKSHT